MLQLRVIEQLNYLVLDVSCWCWLQNLNVILSRLSRTHSGLKHETYLSLSLVLITLFLILLSNFSIHLLFLSTQRTFNVNSISSNHMQCNTFIISYSSSPAMTSTFKIKLLIRQAKNF